MSTQTISCQRREPSGVDHEMQLWLYGVDGSFHFEVCQAYCPGGKELRRCVLATGKPCATREEAISQGHASFDAEMGNPSL